MNACDIVTRTKETLSKPGRWTQGTMRRTDDAYMRPLDEPQFCLLGAMTQACAELRDVRYPDGPFSGEFASRDLIPEYKEAVIAVAEMFSDSPVPDPYVATARITGYNDKPARQHHEIVAVLNEAEQKVCNDNGKEQ